MNRPTLLSWLKEGKTYLPSLNMLNVIHYKNRTNKTPDVYLATISTLRRDNSLRDFIASIPFRYLFVDEAHYWVRGSPSPTMASQLTFYRNILLAKAQVVWFMSGTIFPGQIKYDFVETIRSLGSSEKRAAWTLTDNEGNVTAPYGDAQLLNLSQKWDEIPSPSKTAMLIPLMLMRTQRTMIKGERAMEAVQDKLQEMFDGDIPHDAIKNEITQRQELVHRFCENSNIVNKYNVARWSSYSSQMITRQWNISGRTNTSWWSGFSIDDAMEYERGRRFVNILQQLRKDRRRPLVFAYAVFHQQWAVHVCYSLLFLTRRS